MIVVGRVLIDIVIHPKEVGGVGVGGAKYT